MKRICVFSGNGRRNILVNFRRLEPFHSLGGVAKNLCYGVSHWGVARDRYG